MFVKIASTGRSLRLPVRRLLLSTFFVSCFALPAALATGAQHDSTITITSTYSSGPGSVRDAIERANRSPHVRRILSSLPAGSVVYVFHQLPSLTAGGVEVDAAGLTLSGATCLRPDGRVGCDGLVIGGPDIVVRNLRSTAFTFDGIAVRGPDAKRVRVEHCEVFANEDDGIGISAGATDVLVKGCTSESNGYRTKGKGILVFEYATAHLVDNVIRRNRDGVTISRRAVATLVHNTISDNYDKGLGVAGAEATGKDNLIARNGLPGSRGEKAPNADGLRVTLDSKVSLHDTRILHNGDDGVAALGQTTLRLEGGRIVANEGVGVHAREQAQVELVGVTVEHNAEGDTRVEDEAKLVRTLRR